MIIILKEQPWIKYETMLRDEWRQCMDEGKDVAAFEELSRVISENAGETDCRSAAAELGALMQCAQQRADYPFVEPSDLEDIKSVRPSRRHPFQNTLSREQLSNKLAGAWIGRISGCLLGKPVEGWHRNVLYPVLKMTDNYPMKKYILQKEFTNEIFEMANISKDVKHLGFSDNFIGSIAPSDDDTNYTVFALKLLEHYGKEFSPNDVLEGWLSWIPMLATCTAERMAYRNAATGMLAPNTATYQNPHREFIGAQIRGDFFGYIHPGRPEEAAAMAWRDASVSHIKNGIYGEMFVAAMIAAAAVCDDISTIIEVGLDEIPEKTRIRHDVEKVIEWHNEGLSAEEVIERIHETYDENNFFDWCYVNSNAMIVVMALLFGQKDFGKSICLAVQAAFDTDCNGATVGSIVGMLTGGTEIPSQWTECWKKLRTGVDGYMEVSVQDLVTHTLAVIDKI